MCCFCLLPVYLFLWWSCDTILAVRTVNITGFEFVDYTLFLVTYGWELVKHVLMSMYTNFCGKYYCYQKNVSEPKQGSLHSPRYAHLLIFLGGKPSFVSIDIFLFWFCSWTCLIFLYNYMDCHYYNLKVSFFTFLY